MKIIPQEVVHFFQNQGFVIVSSVDKDGTPHSACKGVIKISDDGEVYLLDVYLKQTYQNLKINPRISITSVDEHKFKGYCLKGKARLLERSQIAPELIKAWEDKITSRITQRLLKNISEKKGHPRHPEALLPKPEYMIVMDVQEIVDLTPQSIKD